jgi:aminomethyltransferase
MVRTTLAAPMAARTPLFDRHMAAGARMVEFGGFEMPLQYGAIRDEHIAVRTRAGLFDLSHMGEVHVAGGSAESSIQRLIANDIARVEVGGAQYAVMCNEAGGIVDDVVVYRDADSFMVVVNAACHDKDVAWIRAHVLAGTEVDDVSAQTALLAVQGPRAHDVVRRLTATDVDAVRHFHSVDAELAGVRARLSRTGYTGEDGFELYVDAADATGLWDAVLEAGSAHGLLPCGLGARDTLRLEAGLRLYGQDMDESVDPFSCGLAWTVKLQKGDFIGSNALQQLDPAHPPHRFVGMQLSGRAIARHGQPVLVGGGTVGEVTSGTYSFTLERGIATASVEPEAAGAASLLVDIRGAAVEAEVVPLPFYRRPKGA